MKIKQQRLKLTNMETTNTIIAMELEDVRYYVEKLKKNETIAIKTGKYTFFVTKLKRDIYTAKNEAGETISEGDALRVSCDVYNVENNFKTMMAQEKKNKERRAEILSKNPDAYTSIKVIYA